MSNLPCDCDQFHCYNRAQALLLASAMYNYCLAPRKRDFYEPSLAFQMLMQDMMDDILNDDDECNDDEEEEEEIVSPPTAAALALVPPFSRPCKKARTEVSPPPEDRSASTVADPSSTPKPFPNVDCCEDPLPPNQTDKTPESGKMEEETEEALLDKARQSTWYQMYLGPDLPKTWALKKFKRRFGQFDNFLKLKEDILHLPEFAQWRPGKTDHAGLVLDLLILGSLRRIRSLLDYDDISCFSSIHEGMHREFFHRFEEYRTTNGHRAPWALISPNRQYHCIDEIENEED